jgi:hypothetical protein
LVLKKPQAPVVQIGSVEAIKQATAGGNGALLTIKSNGGNGNGNVSSTSAKSAETRQPEAVPGD